MIDLKDKDIRYLCEEAQKLFKSQDVLLKLTAPITICGDIHGQFYDLLNLFESGGSPESNKYLFLGDYVDRGRQSIETICLLFAYKIKYPDNVFLLRGNHESMAVNKIYGFYDECKNRYTVKIWRTFGDAFNHMPVSALINDKIICMHGGISDSLDFVAKISDIARPTEIPDQGLLCDLLWSDPSEDLPTNWGANERGVSVTFSRNAVENFLNLNNLDLICRAHQVVEEGYEFFANQRLITIFSAPNYTGEFDNYGGFLKVDQELKCSVHVLEPVNHKKGKKNKNLMKSII